MAAADEKSNGWQTTRTLAECHQYMFDNQLACDVTITFNTPSGVETQNAHKYVLMCRSPVFEEMFNGKYVEVDSFTIDDIAPEVFMEVLRFIYSDEPKLSCHNVLHVMYAAKKYKMDGLVQKCSQCIEKELSIDNVCSVLSNCLLYDEKEPTDKCVALVASNSKVVFDSKEFLSLSVSAMYYVLSAETVHLSPMDIFQNCLRWAKYQQKTDAHKDQTIREILEKCLFQIPLPSMSVNELACIPDNEPELLTDKEQAALFRYIIKPGKGNKAAVEAVGFISFPETQMLESGNRFSSMQTNQWSVSKNTPDRIDFYVSKAVQFHGITLYGSGSAGDKHDVQLQLYQGTVLLCNHNCTTVSTGTTKPICVIMPTPVSITPSVCYSIVAGGNGTPTYSGLQGSQTVTTNGCVFTFQTTQTTAANNGTTNIAGQIPQILFKTFE